MVELGPEAVAAVDAGDAVETRRISQLERDRYFRRPAPGPSADVAQVLAVVEEPGKKGVIPSHDTTMRTRCDTFPFFAKDGGIHEIAGVLGPQRPVPVRRTGRGHIDYAQQNADSLWSY